MSENPFDEAALTWDEKPSRVAIAEGIAQAIRAQIPLDRDAVMLDYGCGTGLLTLRLRPFVREAVGMDSSPGMLEVFRKKVRDMGISGIQTRLGNLEGGDDLPSATFDLIVSAMAMHHVRDVPGVIRRFYDALRPGGHLAIGDLQTEDGSFHENGNTGVQHFGFDLDELTGWLVETGFRQVQGSVAYTIRKENGREYPILVVSGRRP